MTEAALAEGLHVISEKPIATSVDRARELWEQARQAGVVHAVDHEMRFDPAMTRIRRLVADGFIGEPRLVTVNAVLSVGIMPESPLRLRTWYDSHSLGGGFSQQVLSHIVDLTRSLFGDLEPLADASEMTVQAKPSPMRPMSSKRARPTMWRFSSVGSRREAWPCSAGAGWSGTVRGWPGMCGDRRELSCSTATERCAAARNGDPLELIVGDDADRSIVTCLASSAEWQPLIIGLVEEFARAIGGESGPFTFATFEDGVRVCESVAGIGARHAGPHHT